MKKLIIKPFKSKPKLPDDFETKTWAMLQGAVRSVYNKTGVKESKEELYRAVEDMCMHKLGESLYNRLKNECATFINESVDSLIAKTSDNAIFLGLVDQVWRDHCDNMNTLRNIFLYLDRSYALETIGVHSIWDQGLLLFRSRLESRADVENMLIVGLLATIESDRIGQTFDAIVVKRLLRMLLLLGQYQSKFEEPFLRDTNRFFFKEGQAMIEMTDPTDFLVSKSVYTCVLLLLLFFMIILWPILRKIFLETHYVDQ